MKITFKYDQQKDICCLLDYGKKSLNSPHPTKTYSALVLKYGENLTEENAADFINEYIIKNDIDINYCIATYQNDWNSISEQFQVIAEHVFQTHLPHDITVYLTINERCPYNIEKGFFYARFSLNLMRMTVMHELWHFYTWHKFGIEWKDKIGIQKYNDIKESLTVIINSECAKLLPDKIKDVGYPQHAELRSEVEKIWSQERDMEKLWEMLVTKK